MPPRPATGDQRPFKDSSQSLDPINNPHVTLLREREPHRVASRAIHEERPAGHVRNSALYGVGHTRRGVDVVVHRHEREQAAAGRGPRRAAGEMLFERA